MYMHAAGQLAEGPEPMTDGAILKRWGLAGGDVVDGSALAWQLSRLIVDEAPPPTEPRRLIDWIRVRYHQSHRETLETAIAMANVAEMVHAIDDAWPHGLADALTELLDALEDHQQWEDVVVFPALLGNSDAVRRLLFYDTHRDLTQKLDSIATQVCGFQAPAQACVTWRLLYLLCRKVDSELREHLAAASSLLRRQRTRESAVSRPGPCPGVGRLPRGTP